MSENENKDLEKQLKKATEQLEIIKRFFKTWYTWESDEVLQERLEFASDYFFNVLTPFAIAMGFGKFDDDGHFVFNPEKFE